VYWSKKPIYLIITSVRNIAFQHTNILKQFPRDDLVIANGGKIRDFSYI